MKTERLFKSTLDDGGVIIMKVTDMAVLSGGGYQVNGLFGVAVAPVAVGESGAFKTAGVHNLAKPSSEEWAIGDRIAWDNDNRECKKLSQFGDVIGVAIEAAANPSSTGRVWLHGFVRAESEDGTVTYLPETVIPPLTGDIDEFEFVSVTIPGGLLKERSVIEIKPLFSASMTPGPANLKARVYFGGVLYGEWDIRTAEGNTSTCGEFSRTIFCVNSLSAQESIHYSAITDGVVDLPVTTSSIDTTEDVVIAFRGQIDNAGDTLRLKGYRIKLNGV